MTNLKIALLSSYTADFLSQIVTKSAKEVGLDLVWNVAPYGQFTQEILDVNSESRQFEPNVVLLAVAYEHLQGDFADYLNIVEQALTAYPKSVIFVHNFVRITQDCLSLLEWNSPSERMRIAQANIKLAELAATSSRLFVLDLQRIAEQYGTINLFEARFYYLAKMLFSRKGLEIIGEQFLRALNAYLGRRKKVIVLDLDNTLWGGVIGDEGIEGIKLSNDAEGKAFFDFQKLLLRLWKSGVVLAICSKNEESVAMKAIREHPYMVLREENIAAHRINWDNKAGNIQQIAQDLNLGLDSFVFLDDSEHEREIVRTILPQVTVPDLPKDPSNYPSFLASLPYFEALSVSDEDQRRGLLYHEEKGRKSLEQSATSLEDFLTNLEIEMEVSMVDAFNAPRVAQLTQRTNQFNASTKRYTLDDIQRYMADQNYRILTAKVQDKFGEHGLIGVAIINKVQDEWNTDSFLMSCRTLGRGIEDAFLYCLSRLLESEGAENIKIEFAPTEKNKPVQGFLEKAGYSLKDGSYLSALHDNTALPKWVRLTWSI